MADKLIFDTPADNLQPDHWQTADGQWIIGPRKADGGWEYNTPDGEWCGLSETWTREEAEAAANYHAEHGEEPMPTWIDEESDADQG
jgi:hypothetical protein